MKFFKIERNVFFQDFEACRVKLWLLPILAGGFFTRYNPFLIVFTPSVAIIYLCEASVILYFYRLRSLGPCISG